MSDSLRPHESQHTRPPCPSPTPRVHPNSRPLSRWCHPTISSSIVAFSSHPQSFPASGSFLNESVLRIRWPKYWSFSFSISPSNKHPGLIFRMDWLDLLAVQGTLKSLLQHQSSKHKFFSAQLSPQSNSHIHTWLLEKLVDMVYSRIEPTGPEGLQNHMLHDEMAQTSMAPALSHQLFSNNSHLWPHEKFLPTNWWKRKVPSLLHRWVGSVH